MFRNLDTEKQSENKDFDVILTGEETSKTAPLC